MDVELLHLEVAHLVIVVQEADPPDGIVDSQSVVLRALINTRVLQRSVPRNQLDIVCLDQLVGVFASRILGLSNHGQVDGALPGARGVRAEAIPVVALVVVVVGIDYTAEKSDGKKEDRFLFQNLHYFYILLIIILGSKFINRSYDERVRESEVS